MILVFLGHIFTDNITHTGFPFPSQYYLSTKEFRRSLEPSGKCHFICSKHLVPFIRSLKDQILKDPKLSLVFGCFPATNFKIHFCTMQHLSNDVLSELEINIYP